MRTFEKYINRRNIADAQAYFIAKGITTDEQLHEWCANHEIEPPNALLFTTQVQESAHPTAQKTAPAKKTSAKRVTAPEGSTETWHTPAAERPLKKQVKKSSPKKRKVTK